MAGSNVSDTAALRQRARRTGEAENGRDAAFFEPLLAERLAYRRTHGVVVDQATFLKHAGFNVRVPDDCS